MPASHRTAPLSPAANEEYYQLLMSSEKPACGADVPSCTLEEIQSVTSEFILKNAVSGACVCARVRPAPPGVLSPSPAPAAGWGRGQPGGGVSGGGVQTLRKRM